MEILTSEEKEEFMKSRAQKKPASSQLLCSRHPERPLEYYCEPCKLLICGQCMISEHRPHGDINYAMNVLPLHIRHLRKCLPVANSVMAQGMSRCETLRSIESELKQGNKERATEVEKYFAEMHRLLKEREKEILESFQDELKSKLKVVAKHRHMVKESVEYVRKSMLSIDDVSERRADDIKVLIEEDTIKQRLQARMKSVESEIKASEKSISALHLAFNPDPALEVLCRTVGGDLENSEPKFKLIRADTSPTISCDHSLGVMASKPRTQSAGDVHVLQPNALTMKRHSLDSSEPLYGGAQTKQPASAKMSSIAEGEIQEPVIEIGAKGLVGASRHITPCPFGVALANDNNTFLVADVKNHTISIVTTTGKFLDRIGSEGKGDGQLLEPMAVTTDSAGNIYVVDKGNARVQKFSSAGEFHTTSFLMSPVKGQCCYCVHPHV